MIKRNKITLAFISVIVFVVCLIAGVFFKPIFILAAVALAFYLYIDKRYLRCPHCGTFENLERLFYAKTHVYHCRHCGERIEIE